MKNNIYILSILSIFFFTLTSCHDDLDTIPQSTIAPENLFVDLDGATIAVNGIYNGLIEHYNQNFIYMSEHGSHVATTRIPNGALNLYAFYTLNTADRFLIQTWETAYQVIYRANTVINRVPKIDVAEGNETDLKNRLIAEARFLRALMYFNLVRFYGDVPLILQELEDIENTSEVNRPRTASTEIYGAIIEDLEFAEKNLYLANWVSDADTSSYTIDDLGRPTIGAAKGLLAKVYLTKASYPLRDLASYELAYFKAKEVADAGNYELESVDYTALNTLEGKTLREWMFQVNYRNESSLGSQWGSVNNPSGNANAINRGFGRVSPTLQFEESYEDGDPRHAHNIAKNNITATGAITPQNNSTRWYCYKFRFSAKPAVFNTDMNAPVLRFADVLLILAEAANETNRPTEAFDALDRILTRARGNGAIPALVDRGLNQEGLREFIFKERARELCFEGHSKFDIFRAGTAKFLAEVKGQTRTTNGTNKILVDWSDNVQDFHTLYPIPATEIESNAGITKNNPGY